MPQRSSQRTSFEASALLSGAHIHHKIADNIIAAIWRKYILNCAYNITTARYNRTIGQLREDSETAAQYETLVRESWLDLRQPVQACRKLPLTRSSISSTINWIRHPPVPFKEISGPDAPVNWRPSTAIWYEKQRNFPYRCHYQKLCILT